MKKQLGFSVVELIVVIVIIGILASLGTVQMLRSQLVARDKERANDVASIVEALEAIYSRGRFEDDTTIVPSGNLSLPAGVAFPMGYPSTAFITAPTSSNNAAQSTAIYNAINQQTLSSPRAPGSEPNFSLKAASSNAGISGSSAGGQSLNGSSQDFYVYQPLQENGSLCTAANSGTQTVIAPRLVDACVRFNLYYFSEAKNAVQVVRSTGKNNNGL